MNTINNLFIIIYFLHLYRELTLEPRLESLNVPFTFRDDGHLYWDAISDYVQDFINSQRNLDNIMDANYNQWIAELENGFEKAPKALEFFENINNTEDVIALLTRLIKNIP